MVRFLTFTLMRLGVHPANAGVVVAMLPLIVAVPLVVFVIWALST